MLTNLGRRGSRGGLLQVVVEDTDADETLSDKGFGAGCGGGRWEGLDEVVDLASDSEAEGDAAADVGAFAEVPSKVSMRS